MKNNLITLVTVLFSINLLGMQPQASNTAISNASTATGAKYIQSLHNALDELCVKRKVPYRLHKTLAFNMQQQMLDIMMRLRLLNKHHNEIAPSRPSKEGLGVPSSAKKMKVEGGSAPAPIISHVSNVSITPASAAVAATHYNQFAARQVTHTKSSKRKNKRKKRRHRSKNRRPKPICS